MTTDLHVVAIVEGHGEKEAVPKLLNGIWKTVNSTNNLRMDEEPYFVPKGIFLSDNENAKNRRQSALAWAQSMVREKDSGVLILMDADAQCCKEFLESRQVKKACSDIEEYLKGIMPGFTVAEQGYEFWLVAGLGGGAYQGDPKVWLTDYVKKQGIDKKYRKRSHQALLTSKMDIQRAREVNPSFNRFCERFLEWMGVAVG